MSKGRNFNITNIRNFFNLIMFDNNASREEVYNFLHDCLNFVFEYHKLDINNYKIQFHAIKISEDDDYVAFMEYHRYHNDIVFDVYFNYYHLVFKEYSKENLEILFSLMFAAMHEFGHIIQCVEHHKHMIKAIIRENEVTKKFDKNIVKAEPNIQNLIISQFNKHLTAQESISNIERNADYQAYKYCQILFRTMYEQEEDELIKKFYLCGIQYFNKIRQNRYNLYRKSDKLNKQAIKILKQNGIKEEDLLNK